MKTFSELISWELEQERKERADALSLSEDESGGKLSASIMRKMRYLNSAGAAMAKDSAGGYGHV
jgi:hypothetical protein